MTAKDLNGLGAFLNRKFAERVAEEGHDYTVRRFAKEININERTLSRMMDPRVRVKGIQLDQLRKLIRFFGREFTDALDISPG